MSYSPISPDEQFTQLVEEFVSNPDVSPPSQGHRFGSSELKVHGRIFAMLSGGRLVVKLPKARVDALVATGAGERFDPRHDGRLMKEWLVVTPTSQADWLALAREALAFVDSQR